MESQEANTITKQEKKSIPFAMRFLESLNGHSVRSSYGDDPTYSGTTGTEGESFDYDTD